MQRSRRDGSGSGADLAEYRELRMDSATFDAALGAQRDLAARGEHRVSIPDLLIAACAQQHGADVLHDDRCYDVIAKALSFGSRRIPAAELALRRRRRSRPAPTGSRGRRPPTAGGSARA
jgi:hypothetical protein